MEDDNAGVMVLNQEFFWAIQIEVGNPSNELMKKIRKSRNIEENVRDKAEGKEKNWEEKDGVITWEGRVYVPKDRKLRDEVIHLHNDTMETGHPGRFKTAELILHNYWWPRIHGDVCVYVDGCSQCQQTKTFPSKLRGKMSPSKVPQRIWQYVSVDLITQLPLSLGYEAIMVVVDHLLKQIQLVPTNGVVTSVGVAQIF